MKLLDREPACGSAQRPYYVDLAFILACLAILGGMFTVGFLTGKRYLDENQRESQKAAEVLYQLQGCRVSLERRNAMLTECVDLLESTAERLP